MLWILVSSGVNHVPVPVPVPSEEWSFKGSKVPSSVLPSNFEKIIEWQTGNVASGGICLVKSENNSGSVKLVTGQLKSIIELGLLSYGQINTEFNSNHNKQQKQITFLSKIDSYRKFCRECGTYS
ncbi:unnamed protein product [Dovyalis caffra]|uniref:LAGLIDADG homing endonuclease n=1 Tax=Dovyalis caffra TaxID=77055 RepID=A0AAV1RPH8_9ROSI|nr:unnamed protein product [Dovyalis caffra]